MVKHILTAIVLLLSLCVFAKATTKNLSGSLSGKIVTAKGLPIIGASIYIADTKVGSTSDKNGDYSILNILEGKHLVEISHIGYSTLAIYVDINSTTKKDFILSETIVENNGVIITGVSNATTIKKIPFSVVSIRKQELFENVSSNIIDGISKVGGVATLSTGPAIAKPVIRGLGYNRVLTINDGVRQEGQQWGDEHGIEIDEASVSKVELLKGPASLIYGSDAMAGVLNIITNVPIENNTIKASLNNNYQTNNGLRSLNASIAFNKNGFNGNFYTSNRAAYDYKNKYDGYVYNSKFKENNIGVYVGYNGKWGYSHLLVSHFNLITGLVKGERNTDGKFIKPLAGGGDTIANENDFKSITPQIPFQKIEHFKIASDNSFAINKNRLSLNIGFQQNLRKEFGNIDDLNEKSLYFDLKTITYNSQFHFAEKKGYKTSIGINGMQQNNTNRGVEQLIPDYNLFDFGAFIFSKKTYKKITLSGGVRFDSRNIQTKNLMDGVNIKNNSFSKSFSNISASMGIAAEVSQRVNLKFNIAKAYRAPSIPELASNGAHEGTNRYEYGNTTLKNETSIQLDGGVDFTSEHISFSFNAFYNIFSNFIYYSKLENISGGDSLVNVNGDYLIAFKFNQQKANLYGFETMLDIHPHPLDWLHFKNTFSLVRGVFGNTIENNKNLPFIPAPRLISELKSTFKKINNTIKNVYAKVELDNTFTQNNIFTAFNTETVTKGFSLINFGIGADIVDKKNKTILTLIIAAQNIADIGYQNHLSRLKYTAENMATGRAGVFNMGQNFSFKINVPLSFKLK